MVASWKKIYDKHRQHIKKERHHFANKGLYSQSYGFSTSDVWMWVGPQRRLSIKELVLLNCGVGENPIESSLDLKEIKPVNTKGNQSWIFIGKTDFETEAPILRPPDVKSWLIRKDPDAGKDWRQERKGWQRMRCLDGITDSMDMSLRKLWMMVKYRKVCCPTIHGVAKSQTWLRNW